MIAGTAIVTALYQRLTIIELSPGPCRLDSAALSGPAFVHPRKTAGRREGAQALFPESAAGAETKVPAAMSGGHFELKAIQPK